MSDSDDPNDKYESDNKNFYNKLGLSGQSEEIARYVVKSILSIGLIALGFYSGNLSIKKDKDPNLIKLGLGICCMLFVGYMWGAVLCSKLCDKRVANSTGPCDSYKACDTNLKNLQSAIVNAKASTYQEKIQSGNSATYDGDCCPSIPWIITPVGQVLSAGSSANYGPEPIVSSGKACVRMNNSPPIQVQVVGCYNNNQPSTKNFNNDGVLILKDEYTTPAPGEEVTLAPYLKDGMPFYNEEKQEKSFASNQRRHFTNTSGIVPNNDGTSLVYPNDNSSDNLWGEAIIKDDLKYGYPSVNFKSGYYTPNIDPTTGNIKMYGDGLYINKDDKDSLESKVNDGNFGTWITKTNVTQYGNGGDGDGAQDLWNINDLLGKDPDGRLISFKCSQIIGRDCQIAMDQGFNLEDQGMKELLDASDLVASTGQSIYDTYTDENAADDQTKLSKAFQSKLHLQCGDSEFDQTKCCIEPRKSSTLSSKKCNVNNDIS